MNLEIEDWLGRQMRIVDEDGSHAKYFRLTVGDSARIWDQWDAPFGEPSELAREMESVIDGYLPEWPKQAIQILLTAVDSHGNERASFPKTVRGRNVSASKNLTMDPASASIAGIMEHLTSSVEKVLELGNSQVQISQRMIETQQDRIQYLEGFSQAQQEALKESLENHGSGNSEVTEKFAQTIQDNAGPLLDILGKFLETPPSNTH